METAQGKTNAVMLGQLVERRRSAGQAGRKDR